MAKFADIFRVTESRSSGKGRSRQAEPEPEERDNTANETLVEKGIKGIESGSVELPDTAEKRALFKALVTGAILNVGKGFGPWVRVPTITKDANIDGKTGYDALEEMRRDGFVAISHRRFPASVAPTCFLEPMQGKGSSGARRDAKTSNLARKVDSIFDRAIANLDADVDDEKVG